MDTFLYSEDENEFVGADSLEASGLEDFDVGVEGMELGNVTSQLNAGLLPPSPAFEAALAQQQVGLGTAVCGRCAGLQQAHVHGCTGARRAVQA